MNEAAFELCISVKRMIKWMNESMSNPAYEWMNEWITEWMNEWMNNEVFDQSKKSEKVYQMVRMHV